MSNWFETLDGTLAKVWERLVNGVGTQVAFGTVSVAGMPEVRTVVLRSADLKTQTLEIYTDIKSDKITSLRKHPKAAIHLWDADLALQIRLQTEVTILTGDAVMDRWRAVPDHSKLSYGVTPAPGQPIAESTAYTKAPDANAFAVLSCETTHVDAVYLGKIHRRAAFSQDGDWAGMWLAP
jgi:pyridoxamine 5'-phosphate oxidase